MLRTDLKDFHVGESLGEGTFARVVKAKHLSAERSSALKIFKNEAKPKYRAAMVGEAKIMSRLNHRHVLALKSTIYGNDPGDLAALEMELASHQDFFSFVAEAGKLNHALARHYFRQLMLAVEHCHSRGVAHRDIKPENVLLGADHQLKLSDFGLAWQASVDDGERVAPFDSAPSLVCSKPAGTIQYMAPELLSRYQTRLMHDCTKLDVWSAGVSLFVLLCGFPPWSQANPKDKFYAQLMCGQFFKVISRWAHLEPDAQDLLNRIFTIDPLQRPSVAEVLQHPFLNPKQPLSEQQVKEAMESRGHYSWKEESCEKDEEDEDEESLGNLDGGSDEVKLTSDECSDEAPSVTQRAVTQACTTNAIPNSSLKDTGTMVTEPHSLKVQVCAKASKCMDEQDQSDDLDDSNDCSPTRWHDVQRASSTPSSMSTNDLFNTGTTPSAAASPKDSSPSTTQQKTSVSSDCQDLDWQVWRKTANYGRITTCDAATVNVSSTLLSDSVNASPITPGNIDDDTVAPAPQSVPPSSLRDTLPTSNASRRVFGPILVPKVVTGAPSA